ncbi:MAG: PHP domain-containing protein [Bacteroidota bacterium]|nr:PHP domain-containing protein [Bacteroidota bacterium]
MANKYFLSNYPAPEDLRKKLIRNNLPEFREANVHVHTPYSFSAFANMDKIFSMAKKENISVLGINDFFVTDGYDDFYGGAVKNKIFPLFNIEFIGLLKEEQRKGIRINDPNNPGRIYFCGKGLDYPFNPGFLNRLRLNSVIKESQNQMKAMISRLNDLIGPVNPSMVLSYEVIKKKFAHELVRERHLARAVRLSAAEIYPDPDGQIKFLESLYGGKKSIAGIGNDAMLENEIRSNLLKSGGPAFVEENERSFLNLDNIITIILKTGGIPCYPVLLDDSSGNYTEFESDPEKLHQSLSEMKVRCIELIPQRNNLAILKEFVRFFYQKEYLITFGTEHNTPEMIPLAVTARGSEALDNELKRIGWESVCIIAAHQYLRARGMQGYVLPDGNHSLSQKRELTFLGKLVIEFFLQ